MITALISVFLCAALVTQAEEPTVRISVLGLLKPRIVEIGCSQPLELEFAEVTRIPLMISPGETLIAEALGNSIHISIRRADGAVEELEDTEKLTVNGADTERPLSINVTVPNEFQRTLAGKLTLSASGDRLSIVLEAPLEQVVAEAVAAEMGDGAPPQAVASMTVAIRSYIMVMQSNSGGQSHDFADNTQSLLYRGMDGAFGPGSALSLAAGRKAAEETHGLVLTDGDTIVPGYFNACCGGSTATPGMIWEGAAQSDSFSPCRCDFCSGSPNWHWIRRAPLKDVISALGFDAETTVEFEITRHPDSRYVATVIAKSASGEARFAGERFRLLIGRSLGWDVIRSNAFSILIDGDEVVFEGYGFGHGVGLCQAGAIEAARQGWDWRRILTFYYPRCTVRDFHTIRAPR
jgi:stage II sporulation protein D